MDTHRPEANNGIIKKYYGLWILLLTELLFVAVIVFFGDRLYIAVNDNLDSNIALFKMFRDNNCWIDRNTPLPMLGGLSRSILTCGYTLGYLVYWAFETKTAYWVIYGLSVALCGIGFYCLGLSCRKLTGSNISANLFCVFGIIYSFVGIWPTALIGFSLIPWWAFLLLEIYRTKKIWPVLFFILLEYNISGPLIGIFLVFYSFLFCIIVSIRDRKMNRSVWIAFAGIVIIFAVRNYGLLFGTMLSRDSTIKSLANAAGSAYTDGFFDCMMKLSGIFAMNASLYHSGLYTLKYIVFPLIMAFFFAFHLERKRMKIGKEFLIVYDLLVLSLFINACGMAFDGWAAFRNFIPFMSGFSFARFTWLSPFIALLCVLMILHYLRKVSLKRIGFLLICAIPVSIMLDVDADSTSSIYNLLHVNYSEIVLDEPISKQVRWDDYYAPEMFEQIKQEIGYNGEWVVGYGLEPAILQYNAFRTLDGYYSNYPLEYKEKWEEMITPVFKENKDAQKYWESSNGQRAYIYSPKWVFPDYGLDYEKMGDVKMLIEPEILRDFGCKYVLSNVAINNAESLGLEFIKTWSTENGAYNIRVYRWKSPKPVFLDTQDIPY